MIPLLGKKVTLMKANTPDVFKLKCLHKVDRELMLPSVAS